MKTMAFSMDGQPARLFHEDVIVVDGVVGRHPGHGEEGSQEARLLFELIPDRAGGEPWHYRPGAPVDEERWLRYGEIWWAGHPW
jgi:hypothetical protein